MVVFGTNGLNTQVEFESKEARFKLLVDGNFHVLKLRLASLMIRLSGALPFKYATVVKRWDHDEGRLTISHVVPRWWPLRLGAKKYTTQGKSANQLNATRKLWGHVTQVMDANMVHQAC